MLVAGGADSIQTWSSEPLPEAFRLGGDQRRGVPGSSLAVRETALDEGGAALERVPRARENRRIFWMNYLVCSIAVIDEAENLILQRGDNQNGNRVG